MTRDFVRIAALPVALAAALVLLLQDTDAPAAAQATAPAGTEMQFTLDERALLDCLKAVLPQTVTVGSGLFSTELTFLDPSDLVLKEGTASCRVRVKGKTLPVDQVLQPIVRLERDAKTGQYYGVISSLPLTLPGMGKIDLKDALPRLEVPQVVDNLHPFGDRPVGLRFSLRRLAIHERRVEIGADLDLSPGTGTARRTPTPGEGRR
ncbi:MAG TPA: hypothetical protein VFD06_02540 [Candidatus Polarisedimenticolia bacterium]|nr:hypothetical protein [Candidatus Polarisedimenticolia bacterium]